MNPAIEVRVSGDPTGDYRLQIALMNQTNRALSTYAHMLPWVGETSLILVAVKTDAVGTVLEKRAAIDDPGPGVITIRPNETLSGEVNLGSRFPDLRPALSERDVALFWSYQFRATDGTRSPRTGGFVLLLGRARPER